MDVKTSWQARSLGVHIRSVVVLLCSQIEFYLSRWNVARHCWDGLPQFDDACDVKNLSTVAPALTLYSRYVVYHVRTNNLSCLSQTDRARHIHGVVNNGGRSVS